MPCPVVSDELLESFEPLLFRLLNRRGHDRFLDWSKGVVSTQNNRDVFGALSRVYTLHQGPTTRARNLSPPSLARQTIEGF
jgi:hypothetical protein